MLYDYECGKCKLVLEVSHGANEKCVMSCIKCHKLFKRILSPVAFVLSGKGFYGRGRT